MQEKCKQKAGGRCIACANQCIDCVYRCIPRKLMKAGIALWVVFKIVFMIGVIVICIQKGIFPTIEKLNYGNLQTFPGVTYQQMEADYWTRKESNSAKTLMSTDEIFNLNQRLLRTKATHMYDLENEKEQVDGVGISSSLIAGVQDSMTELSCLYQADGNLLTEEFIINLAIEARNPSAKIVQNVEYLICTTETDLRAYPTTSLLLEDPLEPDEDYNQLSSIRVGEPMVAISKSSSGRFYLVKTSNCMGWVEAEHVGVCRDKEQWLCAWKFNADEIILVTGTEIQLPYSNVTPQFSGKVLSMGASLQLVPQSEIPESVQGRSVSYNYVVYMPARMEDGTFTKKMALIPKNADISVGYLEMTLENIMNQVFKFLGNVYGWGGMLHSQDCSGLIRDVYKCFGLELPRNTTWQQEMPVEKKSMTELSRQEKKKVLEQLPSGSLLFMDGHVMLYLGKDRGDYFCISAAGTVMNAERTAWLHLKCISINSLTKTYRPDNTSWIDNLTSALIIWK